MKNAVALLVIVGIIAGALFFSGNIPSCSFDPGPERPGTFKGERGWESLAKAPEPFFNNVWTTLYDPSTLTQYANIMSGNFAIRLYSGGQDFQIFGIKLTVSMVGLEEYTIPSDGWGAYSYSKADRGKSGLRPSGKTILPDEIIEQEFGPKRVSLCKFYDLPSGSRWLLTTPTGQYYVEIQ